MSENRNDHTVCRDGCGACCIAPSLSSPLPGMPEGKPAGVRCAQLTPENRCGIYGRPERPAVCASFPARPDHCGASREEALRLLDELERLTEGPRRRDRGRTVMAQGRFIDSGPATGAVNMAMDARLLEEAAAADVLPVLRFYSWSPPAVSLGRFQEAGTAVDANACRKRGIDIVRRITGGRAVLHDRELTYSVVARTDKGLFPDEVMGTYKMIAGGLLAGFHRIGVPAEMVSRSGKHRGLVKDKPREPACFSSPSWYEIVVNGRKIVGSAQRRVSGAFLQHGSILIEYDPALEAEVIPGGGGRDAVTSIRRETGRDVPVDAIKDAFREGLSRALGIVFE